ncbi:MAG TPA: hypothetical protein VLA88_05825 [Candidatus Saccharimonadales bacterium]|nr:hypothetical protein [Candidatus Saccharimonadales bacterium]
MELITTATTEQQLAHTERALAHHLGGHAQPGDGLQALTAFKRPSPANHIRQRRIGLMTRLNSHYRHSNHLSRHSA